MSRLTRLAPLVLGIVAVLATAASASQGPRTGRVWVWFNHCQKPRMTLQVEFDGATIFKSSFPICKESSMTSSRQLNFTFKPSRAIVWKGYRDSDNTTRPGQTLQGSIWEAGGDPRFLILGVVFMTRKDIYMNTLCIAYPDKREQTEIERGLTVTTYPEKLK